MFTQVSPLIQVDVKEEGQYKEGVKLERASLYVQRVDSLNFKLIEKLADAILDGRIDIDAEAATLAHSIKTIKSQIREEVF